MIQFVADTYKDSPFDLVLLDVMLPGLDGFAVKHPDAWEGLLDLLTF